MAAKIRKGDTVIVITGKDKGRKGEVLKSFPEENRVLVSGVNIKARHTKPSRADPQGGIKRNEAPIHVSNVAHRRSDVGQAHPRRFQNRRNWRQGPQGALRQAFRGGRSMADANYSRVSRRCIRRSIRDEADEAVRLHERHAGAARSTRS